MVVSELSCEKQPLCIMHIASGDLWAGAEVQLFTLVSALNKMPTNTLHVVLLNEGELSNRLRSVGVAVSVIDEQALSAMAIFSQLKTLIREVKPDIVHTHRFKENILGALANALTVSAFSVRTVHGAPEFVYGPFNQPLKWLAHCVDVWVGKKLQGRVIAVSAPLAEQLACYYPGNHISIILNGVDVAHFDAVKPAAVLTATKDVVHVGVVGRLVSVKRVDLFLEMCKWLVEADKGSFQFHIVGDGPLDVELQQKCHALGLDDDVVFYGHRSDVAAFIAGLDVLVMCSDHEGLPMTALEALALGTPVVAHAVGGLCDLLAGCEVSRLVCEHSPEAYAQSVMACLDDVNKRTAVILPHQYTAVRNAEQIMMVYRRGVDAKGLS